MIRMALPVGETMREMRENIRGTTLHQLGDARLMWVNEGDMVTGQILENVRVMANDKEGQADGAKAE